MDDGASPAGLRWPWKSQLFAPNRRGFLEFMQFSRGPTLKNRGLWSTPNSAGKNQAHSGSFRKDHPAQNDTNRSSAIDQRTTRHTSYEVSQRKRKRVEQSFGWMKMVGALKKVKLRGIDKVGWLFTFTGAAYNLCRLRNLMARA